MKMTSNMKMMINITGNNKQQRINIRKILDAKMYSKL